ncbi:transporter substrate-binding domain-containing protein [uncultured Roseobacter sp.]|uniref:transporter substrate-binding domain-containing protein n=1 Tax=uncultured Roseobacter sp. TaxID=114847 RepID=UPI00263A2FD8|nr:transporter substrate-binding domain-containing protein [uncultured Roseobacter sp.]
MKQLISTIALAALMATPTLADTIRMGTEGAYPPFNFIDDNGELSGFEIELGNQLCEIAELECTWVTNDWDSIIPNLVSGNYDTIMAGMGMTDERDEVIDFSEQYFPPDPSAYVAVAGADTSVRSGVVAAQINTIQSGYVANSDATLVEFATPDETVAAVRNGEVDAVLADRSFLNSIVEESNGALVFVGDDIEIGRGVGIGMRESDQALRESLNAAIRQMKDDGSLSALIAKWFDGRVVEY